MTTETQPNPQKQPLRSVYTSGLPQIFAQLNISLVISTYQAGKVILVRHDAGPATNGHGPTGAMNTQLPGFTRGLDFYGPLAFIGLSQVRETATFSSLPLIDRLGEERTCGVWVVHTDTGQTMGFLRFESGVQEIFAVQVLPNIRFPEMLEWEDERLSHSYVLPDAALAERV